MKKTDIKAIYPLSPLQGGMLFHSIYTADSSAYFEQLSFDLKGELRIEYVETSFNLLIERYDVLRTIFVYEKINNPQQIVLKERKAEVYFEDISGLTESERIKFINNYKRKDRDKGFNLNKDLLFRLSVLKTNEYSYRLIWSNHHILMDGWSRGFIIENFFDIYKSLIDRNDLKTVPVVQFSKYIDWLEGKDKEAGSRFWMDCLYNYENASTISSKVIFINDYINATSVYRLSEQQTKQLEHIANQYQVTLNTVFQTVWGLMLQKYNNVNDVIFGAVVSGRPSEIAGIERMVGLFINTVPVRITTNQNQSFSDLMKQVQQAALESEPYHYCSLAEIQSNSEMKQELIDHILVFQNYMLEAAIQNSNQEEGLGFEICNVDKFEQTNYNLNVIVEPGAELTVTVNYNAAVYDASFIQSLESYIKALVQQVVENPDMLIREMTIVPEKENHRLLFEFNDTAALYPAGITIHQLFEQQVRQHPEKIAVVYEDAACTYKELNERSNQLARVLRSKGIKPDSIVAIMAERSIDMIVGIIGVLKAGGAYLPIDPGFPANRIEYMIGDSGAAILLTQTKLLDRIKFPADIIDLQDAANYEGDSTNLEHINSPNNLAYIIYTSGTTGNPKGVMIEHLNLIRLLINDRSVFDFTSEDIWTMFHSFCFDFSVWEMYGALLFGGKLIVVPTASTRDPGLFLDLLKREQVTILNQTPTAFYNVIDEEIQSFSNELSLRYVIFGGEALAPAKLKEWKEKYPDTKLINMYGITETTVHVTYREINDDDICTNSSNIGVALPTLTTYIMNKDERLMPIGVVGELYVGGAGVCRGYLNRSDLTNQKFIQNRYVSNEKLYKTGDLAKRLKDGSLEYLGRCDHQVKIRGFRIELGDIESQLLRHENIKEAIVTVNSTANGSLSLCAYVVYQSKVTTMQLRDYLFLHLPDYMIPSHYVELERLPVTSNGKIDRNALPKPDTVISNNSSKLPETDIEKIFVQIWKDVLGVNSLGVEDNFFYLGGDSIKAIQIMARLLKHDYKMEIRDLFESPTIREVSYRIKSVNRSIHQGQVEGNVQLSPIQRWFFAQNFTDMHYWNQAVFLYRREGFNETILNEVFGKLTEHHDALRMVYQIENGEIVQRNKGAEGSFHTLKVVDLRREHNYEGRIEQEVKEIHRSIRLNEGPLLRSGLFKTETGDHLFIAIHHLVIDGVSWRILFEDFIQGYKQAMQNEVIRLQEKTDSYQSWSAAMEVYANNKALIKEISYWKSIESRQTAELPKDKRIIQESKMKDNGAVTVSLSEDRTGQLLTEVNQAYRTQIDDILLTALGLTIAEWTGQKEILLGMEGHGREELVDIDITRTVGWFTSIYPVVLDMGYTHDLKHQIKTVKEDLRHIPNKGVGYGLLKYVTAQENKRGLTFQIRPEISFNYMGQFDQDMNTELFEASTWSTGAWVSENSEREYTLTIGGIIISGQLTISFHYDRNEYNEDTVQRLVTRYKSHLEKIIDHCLSVQEEELTPTDYGDQDLSIDDAEYIENLFG